MELIVVGYNSALLSWNRNIDPARLGKSILELVLPMSFNSDGAPFKPGGETVFVGDEVNMLDSVVAGVIKAQRQILGFRLKIRKAK